MIKEKIAEIVEERIRICEETGDNWDYGIEQCWKKYIEVIAVDIDKNIFFTSVPKKNSTGFQKLLRK